MNRFLLIFFLLLAIAAGAAYALNEYIAKAITQRSIKGVQAVAAARDTTLTMRFSGAEFHGVGTIACDGLEGRVRLAKSVGSVNRSTFTFAAKQVVVSVRNPFTGRVKVSIAGGLISAYDANDMPTGERVANLNGEFDLFVNLRDRAETGRMIASEFQRLAREGWVDFPARVDAVAEFRVGPQDHQVAIRSSSDGRKTTVILDRDDVALLGQSYTHPLTDAEIDLVSQNPVRARRLLDLAERSISTAISFRREQKDFPYDAFRHVYWSWLLTREFGPVFSEKVTDAHEVGATYEAGAAARRMDIHNNSVGRAYGLANVPEHELVDRVYNDPNVIRSLSLSTEVPARN